MVAASTILRLGASYERCAKARFAIYSRSVRCPNIALASGFRANKLVRNFTQQTEGRVIDPVNKISDAETSISTRSQTLGRYGRAKAAKADAQAQRITDHSQFSSDIKNAVESNLFVHPLKSSPQSPLPVPFVAVPLPVPTPTPRSGPGPGPGPGLATGNVQPQIRDKVDKLDKMRKRIAQTDAENAYRNHLMRLIKVRDHDAALAMYKRGEKDFATANQQLIFPLLTVCYRFAHLKSTEELLLKLAASGESVQQRATLSVIRCLTAEDAPRAQQRQLLDRAIEIVESVPRPRLRMYNPILKALCKRGYRTRALDVLEKVFLLGSAPNEQQLAVVLAIFAHSGPVSLKSKRRLSHIIEGSGANILGMPVDLLYRIVAASELVATTSTPAPDVTATAATREPVPVRLPRQNKQNLQADTSAANPIKSATSQGNVRTLEVVPEDAGSGGSGSGSGRGLFAWLKSKLGFNNGGPSPSAVSTIAPVQARPLSSVALKGKEPATTCAVLVNSKADIPGDIVIDRLGETSFWGFPSAAKGIGVGTEHDSEKLLQGKLLSLNTLNSPLTIPVITLKGNAEKGKIFLISGKDTTTHNVFLHSKDILQSKEALVDNQLYLETYCLHETPHLPYTARAKSARRACMVELSHDTATCPNCGERLPRTGLSRAEIAQVRDALYDREHNTWKQNGQPFTLKHFSNFLAQHAAEHGGRFPTYIVDACNVAYHRQNFSTGKFSYRQIELVVIELQKRIAVQVREATAAGRKVPTPTILVVLPQVYTHFIFSPRRNKLKSHAGTEGLDRGEHNESPGSKTTNEGEIFVPNAIPNRTLYGRRKTFNKYNGKEAVTPEDMSIMRKLERDKMLYFVPDGECDDWFWLFATVNENRTPDNPAYVITNDLMRDHKESFFPAGNMRTFARWRSNSVMHFDFSHAAEDGSSLPEVRLCEPANVTREIHYDPEHSEMPRVHVPASDRSSWVCLSMESGNFDTSALPDVVDMFRPSLGDDKDEDER